MRQRTQPIVFSDIDGCLVDHSSPSTDVSGPAVHALRARAIPLVLCSSRTRAEIERFQGLLETTGPFVSENGGALFVPIGSFPFTIPGARRMGAHDVVSFGRAYDDVVEVLRRTADRIGVAIAPFSAMSVQQVAEECGLSLADARLAKLRDYDEPFRILTDDHASRARLIRALQAEGLRCTPGRRYDHAGGETDKGIAVEWLRRLYRRVHGDVITVGLGAAPDDLGLLRAVDLPVIVRNPVQVHTDTLARRLPAARVTTRTGSCGWRDAVFDLFEDLAPVPASVRTAVPR